MPAVALLSDDLLFDILHLAAGSDIALKFTLAQVSTHWRRVALESPLFWTHISLSTYEDCDRLPLVLDRCGPSAPLEIEVPGFEVKKYRLDRAMRLFEPFASRIRVLHMERPSYSLLGCDLEFPILRILRIRGCASSLQDAPYKIHLRAPNLRVLELSGVMVVGFLDILSDRLVELFIERCLDIDYAEFLAVLACCINVEELTFHCNGMTGHLDHLQRYDTRHLNRLQVLDVALPLPLITQLLENVTGGCRVLRALTAYTNEYIPESLWDIAATLLRGMGPFTTLTVSPKGGQYFRLCDEAGRERALGACGGMIRPLSCTGLWAHLSEKFAVNRTVTAMMIGLSVWNPLADDFVAYPPNATLHWVIIHLEDVHLIHPISSTSSLRSMFIPGLRQVHIAGCRSETDLSLMSTIRIVVHILRSIGSDRGHDIELHCDRNVLSAPELRDFLEGEGRGRWKMALDPEL